MRTYHIQGPSGVNISLATSIPGTITIAYPDRAQSEPPTDTETAKRITATIRRVRSEYIITVPVEGSFIEPEVRQAIIHVDNDNLLLGQMNKPHISEQVRASSPTPTQVDDPDHEDILAGVKALGIKVRDFAYEKSSLQQVKEVFFPRKGLAEYEHRLSQPIRDFPVSGKVLRRLLDLGWIDEAETQERCAAIDLEDLYKHDSRPFYPWSSIHCTHIPSRNERKPYIAEYLPLLRLTDRMRRDAEEATRALEEEQRMLEEKHILEDTLAFVQALDADVKARYMTSEASCSLKRSFSYDREDTAKTDGEPKRKRRSPEPSTSVSLSQNQHLQPPPKQYPAPLSSYDPKLYPDAAEIIESSSQSQPRPVFRSDTPPLECDTPPPRPAWAGKKGLGRQQTFTDLRS